MATVDVYEAKSSLSRLIAAAEAGETIVIARNGKPVAQLGPIAHRATREPGRMNDQVRIADDLDEWIEEVDLREVRSAIARADAEGFLAAVVDRNLDDVLQQVGAGVPLALEKRREGAEPLALSLIERLTRRAAEGDQVLVEDLGARMRNEPLRGRAVPVDLDELSAHLECDPSISAGAYVDLQTGEVYAESDADPMMVGEEAAIDVDSEPDRWLWLEHDDSRAGWHDMAEFAARQRDAALRERLEEAIEGRGAFGRFRLLVHQEGLGDRWNAFASDRQWGRARELLAAHDIRAL